MWLSRFLLAIGFPRLLPAPTQQSSVLAACSRRAMSVSMSLRRQAGLASSIAGSS